ncbi:MULTISPECIES: phosphatase PAP2 family protein [unclassified Microbacterium]|uniref:phosphatase PAP2 family protein n=1 Tax=unclassified Microbacterium TaxID=2609290 RepID=UPI00301ABFF8
MTVRSWHFLAIAAGLVVAFVGSYLFFVHGYMGQLLDEQARIGAQSSGVTRFADALDLVPLVSAGVVLVAVMIGLVRRQVLATVVALGVVAASNLTTQLLKHQLLSRPDNGATGEWHNSFPSGHTTVAASAIFALFLVCAPRLRPLIAALGAIIMIVIGALLVGNGWHRPSDVVGGILVVAIFVFLGGAVLAPLRPPASRARPGVAGTIALLVVASVACAVAFGAAYLAVAGGDEAPEVSMLAGLVAITVTSGATALLAARLFRRVG